MVNRKIKQNLDMYRANTHAEGKKTNFGNPISEEYKLKDKWVECFQKILKKPKKREEELRGEVL